MQLLDCKFCEEWQGDLSSRAVGVLLAERLGFWLATTIIWQQQHALQQANYCVYCFTLKPPLLVVKLPASE